jgi:H+/gluconate symporter-like permease
MDVGIILLSFLLLMFFAYRGFSIILFAPVFALLAASYSELSLMPVYSELFMTKVAEYTKMYFSVFLLGAVFGKVMEDSGMAGSIARAIMERLGKEHAILAVVLACAALTYGGVSVFVVVFVIYPFAAVFYKEAEIPKRLIPASLWLGTFSFSMGAFPGSPQIQNIIPTAFYGTTTWAAPITGIVSGLVIFGAGMSWLIYRRNQAAACGEGYGMHTHKEPQIRENDCLPPLYIAIIPLLAVVIINLYLSNPFKWAWAHTWDPNMLHAFQPLKISLLSPSVERVQAIWSLNIALVVGILFALTVGWQRICVHGGAAETLNAGAVGSLLAILNTASGFGFGSVISNLAGFGAIKSALMQIKIGSGPLVSETITVNILAGLTGSASGGLTIALGMLGKDYLEWAQTVNMSPEILHRIACLAAGGLDSLPHNGGLITVMAVCGLTHKESYSDVFALTIIKMLVPFVFIAFYATTGLL